MTISTIKKQTKLNTIASAMTLWGRKRAFLKLEFNGAIVCAERPLGISPYYRGFQYPGWNQWTQPQLELLARPAMHRQLTHN